MLIEDQIKKAENIEHSNWILLPLRFSLQIIYIYIYIKNISTERASQKIGLDFEIRCLKKFKKRIDSPSYLKKK